MNRKEKGSREESYAVCRQTIKPEGLILRHNVVGEKTSDYFSGFWIVCPYIFYTALYPFHLLLHLFVFNGNTPHKTGVIN